MSDMVTVEVKEYGDFDILQTVAIMVGAPVSHFDIDLVNFNFVTKMLEKSGANIIKSNRHGETKTIEAMYAKTHMGETKVEKVGYGFTKGTIRCSDYMCSIHKNSSEYMNYLNKYHGLKKMKVNHKVVLNSD